MRIQPQSQTHVAEYGRAGPPGHKQLSNTGVERSQETGPALGVRAAAGCIPPSAASNYAVACRLPFLPRSPAAG